MGNFSNIPNIKQIIRDNGTDITIYFAVKSAGDDYDPYSKNYQFTNLNPHTIKGYVTQISPEKLVWKQYGLEEIGAVEILCESKYKDWFKTCNQIFIGSDEYLVYKIGTGNKTLIQDRPGGLIRVILEKKG